MTKQLTSHKDLRAIFICPHDKKHCARANQCCWSKDESCAKYNAGVVSDCKPYKCKKRPEGCNWTCTRDKDR